MFCYAPVTSGKLVLWLFHAWERCARMGVHVARHASGGWSSEEHRPHVKTNKNQWKPMKIHENQWNFMVFDDFFNFIYFTNTFILLRLDDPHVRRRRWHACETFVTMGCGTTCGWGLVRRVRSISLMGNHQKFQKNTKNQWKSMIFDDFWYFLMIFPWSRCSSLDLLPPSWCTTHPRKSFPDMKQQSTSLPDVTGAYQTIPARIKLYKCANIHISRILSKSVHRFYGWKKNQLYLRWFRLF